MTRDQALQIARKHAGSWPFAPAWIIDAIMEAADVERDAMCAAIKAADDKAMEADYMLDSNDCINVIRGTWQPDAATAKDGA